MHNYSYVKLLNICMQQIDSSLDTFLLNRCIGIRFCRSYLWYTLSYLKIELTVTKFFI